MSQYYFTVSSLPGIDLDSEPSINSSEFLEICRSSVSEEDFSIISMVSLDSFEYETENTVLKRWAVFEQSLRNELAALRSGQTGIDSQKYVRQFIDDTTAPGIAAAALKQENPLKTEMFLMRARWTFLDELEVGHFFDIEKLIVYFIRLLLLERKALFNEQAGNNNFMEIYEQIKTAIREM